MPHAVHAIGLGCPIEFARELVYADGVDLDNVDAAVPVGVTCRLCERLDCEQRAFPALQNPLQVDENVRGVSLLRARPGLAAPSRCSGPVGRFEDLESRLGSACEYPHREMELLGSSGC